LNLSEPLKEKELRAAIARFGDNCNSFLSLYRGFDYFEREGEIICYADTKHAWVAASEPLCEPERRAELLRAFAEEARKNHKLAISIPVSGKTAELAQSVGYQSLKIGTEPRFDLAAYDPAIDRLATAKQMANRGAEVEEFRPEKISADCRRELDRITSEWLAARKTVALSFLNTVDPWALAADKRYFLLKQKGTILAFVAAIPIWTCNGWYLIDLLRRNNAPAGSTELLMLESMRLLKKSGARQISLGVAPLSGLESLATKSKVYRLMHFIFDRGSLLYNFKPLYVFKQKFQPTHAEDAYLIFHPSGFSPRVLRGLSEAFLPNGIFDATMTGLLKGVYRFRLANWVSLQASDAIVLRPPPRTLRKFLYRIRWTLAIWALIYLVRAITTPEWLNRFAFTVPGLLSFDVSSLLISPFLHWDRSHLLFNTISLFLLCGTVEYVAGSVAMLICFLFGAFFGNPLTVASLNATGWLVPRIWTLASSERDVGTSLGIFACGGAFPYLFKHGRWITIALLGFCVIYSVATHSLLALNHIAALALGFVAFGAWLSI
jgi:membrane associated rhomboid family serine protease